MTKVLQSPCCLGRTHSMVHPPCCIFWKGRFGKQPFEFLNLHLKVVIWYLDIVTWQLYFLKVRLGEKYYTFSYGTWSHHRQILTTGILSVSRQFKKKFLLSIRPPPNPHLIRNHVALYFACAGILIIISSWRCENRLRLNRLVWITHLIGIGTLRAFQ